MAEDKAPELPGKRLQLAPEDVGALAAVFAARPDRAAWERCSYDRGWLLIPEDIYPLIVGIDLIEARRGALRDRAVSRRRALLNKPIGAGVQVWTDRGTRTDLDQLIAGVDNGVVTEPVAYKCADGRFALLSAAALVQIRDRISLYVAAAFAAEAVVLQQIEAGSITTPAEVDGAAWPVA